MRSWFLLLLAGAGVSLAKDVQDCSCGFLDSESGELYTDATIVYFNETTQLPEDFQAQEILHEKEFGWNSVFRMGARPENAIVGNSTMPSSNWDAGSLGLFVDPSTPNHLVNGASIESIRQDMLYGSIRAFMRGGRSWIGGTAMSLIVERNRTLGFDVDILNTNTPSLGRITTLKNGEFPSYKVSTNHSSDPWVYWDIKVDWTKHFLNFTVDNNKTRVVDQESTIPSVPMPLIFRHYSTGDSGFMMGPPIERSEGNLAWVRAFFNSSLTTKASRKEYDTRCSAQPKCDVDNIELRGSTSYSPEALVPYKVPGKNTSWGVPAAILCGSASALGLLTLINVFFKRQPWKTMFNGEKRYEPAVLDLGQGLTSPFVLPESLPLPDQENLDTLGDLDTSVRRRSTLRHSRYEMMSPGMRNSWYQGRHSQAPGVRNSFVAQSPGMRNSWVPQSPGMRNSWMPPQSPAMRSSAVQPKTATEVEESGLFQNDFEFAQEGLPEIGSSDFAAMFQTPRVRQMSLFARSRVQSAAYDDDIDRMDGTIRDIRDRRSSVFQSVARSVVRLASVAPSVSEAPIQHPTNEHVGEENNIDIKEWNTQVRHEIPTVDPVFNALQGRRRPTMQEAVPIAAVDLPLPAAKAKEQRVNYLAGLVAFACLAVTATHFCLTFVPYAGGYGSFKHYSKSEEAARWWATPFLMDPVWLGPLFVTSCRFLAGGFFKKGDLKEIAQRMLLRAPRMLIPALIVAVLEYFFLEEGLLYSLDWLPSISWSPWPYIIDYNNFAQFLNDILELAYLIPNAAPQIVEHYCVGVLWTVPVQLQFSYTALLAAVIIRDIKRPYKRFLVYGIAILTNWYALNWGSCFWAGVMLADLQITYDASNWLRAHPKVWYPLAIVLWALALACPTMSLLEDRLIIPTMTMERNIHPDFITGKRLIDTPRAAYPMYYEPRLNTVVFAASLQFLLETSTWFQAFFSLRFWQPIFPHAYTVYLTHGFIWWSLGSYLVVELGVLGLPYWANMLVNALCCYTCLALVVVGLSPLTEMASAAACRNIQRWTTTPAVPYRGTLSPFSRELFLDKPDAGGDEMKDEEEAGSARTSEDSLPKEPMPTDIKESSNTLRPVGKGGLVSIMEVPSSGTSMHGSVLENVVEGSVGESSSSNSTRTDSTAEEEHDIILEEDEDEEDEEDEDEDDEDDEEDDRPPPVIGALNFEP